MSTEVAPPPTSMTHRDALTSGPAEVTHCIKKKSKQAGRHTHTHTRMHISEEEKEDILHKKINTHKIKTIESAAKHNGKQSRYITVPHFWKDITFI